MHYERWKRTKDPEQLVSKFKKEYEQEYTVWCGMKARCCNANNNGYKNYGGRGIKVCNRWLEKPYGFINFIKDMGERPKGNYSSGLSKYSLERIDNDGNYEPENCKWATRHEQARNTRMGIRGESRKVGVWRVHAKYGDYWVATIGIDGKTITKWAKTEQEAIKHRKWLEDKYL